MSQHLFALQDLGAEAAAPLAAPPSVLHELNQANRRLEKILTDLRNELNADADLRHIARDVMHAVDLSPDIALASLFLCQIAGTYAVRHCIETAVVVVLVARGMGKAHEEVLSLTAAALTMNVGMVRQHDGFQCTPGALSSEDMALVRRHPEDGAEMLKYAGIDDEEWISCVLMHHESDDGSGYPQGMTHEQITQNARLLSIADRYCARVSARNYRCSLLPDAALDKLLHDPAHPADPDIAAQFHRQIGRHPPGALVRLANGDTGVVVLRANGEGVVEVRCLRDGADQPIAAAVQRRSCEPGCTIESLLSEDDADLRVNMRAVWGALAAL